MPLSTADTSRSGTMMPRMTSQLIAAVSSIPRIPAVDRARTALSRSSPTDFHATAATRSRASLTAGSFSSTSENAVWRPA